MRVDPVGFGIACYYNQSDGSDPSRRRIIIATLAGFFAEKRFYSDAPIPQTDWHEAHQLIDEMSTDTVFRTSEELQSCSAQLVSQHWPAIEALALAVLAKDWVLQVRFESGPRWSHPTTTMEKCITGEEAVNLLKSYEIAALCA
jgi:hypothetical protein